ncbi:MAG: hypothetical protein ACWGQW_09855 [bacterium]
MNTALERAQAYAQEELRRHRAQQQQQEVAGIMPEQRHSDGSFRVYQEGQWIDVRARRTA